MAGRAGASTGGLSLFSLVVYIVIGGLGAVLAEVSEANGGTAGGGAMVLLILLGIFVLGSILPGIAVTVRRLHDAGYSGILYLINLISVPRQPDPLRVPWPQGLAGR